MYGKNDTKRQVDKMQCVTEIGVGHTNGSRRRIEKIIKTIQIEEDNRRKEERVPGVSTWASFW